MVESFATLATAFTPCEEDTTDCSTGCSLGSIHLCESIDRSSAAEESDCAMCEVSVVVWSLPRTRATIALDGLTCIKLWVTNHVSNPRWGSTTGARDVEDWFEFD